ncbi:hypothetical protein CSUB01_10814 [Colletotrichum sublineola]|uniref:Peptidase S1 domain-containing protein n=1 Tax=Colletotrichum sublineola TaxID=1173701 RepID=A0A066X7N7_COLSU|nr:hypothetical protein CSUB01_10814 [Colletotrichum sublineola]
MDPQRSPTRAERDSFYNGLPSRPKLVARSSTTPLRLGLDGWSSERKTLTVVGEHAIVGKWNDEPSSLRNDILDILARQKVDWQAVDILRIGYADDKTPVILSISVSAGTPWEVGSQVARDCREALVENGLDDVHCEIKESRLVNLASVLQQDSHQHPPYFHSYMYHLSDQLGTSIASREVPYREGTKGIYLRRAGGGPDQIFALTCRHVCYLESEGCLLPKEKSLSSKSIIHLPERTTERLVKELNERRDDLIEGLRREEAKGEPYNQGDNKPRSDKIATYQQAILETDRLLQNFILREDLDTRVFGYVAYASDYVVRTSKCLSDWCLIRLEAESHERRLSELSNRVYIGPQSLSTLFPRTVRVRDPDHDGTLHIQDVVAVSELQNTKRKLTVGMRGRTSDLRFGLVNQVKSVTRRVLIDGEAFLSQECCIVADRVNCAFSERGDSGACVFDLEGRAVGMVTSGITRDEVLQGNDDYGLDRAMDVTYATPMEWLLADMKACGLSMEIL